MIRKIRLNRNSFKYLLNLKEYLKYMGFGEMWWLELFSFLVYFVLDLLLRVSLFCFNMVKYV